MKYSVKLLLVISFFGLLNCGHKDKDGFQKLMASISDVKLKKALHSFKIEGIEKPFPSDEEVNIERLIKIAESYLGTPHCMGGTTKKCIDCSGLLWTSFNQLEVAIPHSSHDQAKYGKIIPSINELKRGDMVYFYDTYETSKLITHAGIYLGEDLFIHSSTKKGVEKIALSTEYWKSHYLFATRISE